MTRLTRFATLIAAATLGVAVGTPASAALTTNALTTNALSNNALTTNALTTNGLAANARASSGVRVAAAQHAPAGLVGITLPSGVILAR